MDAQGAAKKSGCTLTGFDEPNQPNCTHDQGPERLRRSSIMDLYACGSNEAANLRFPASCQRYYLRRSNPCIHNNWGRDPHGLPYCPNMVLKPVKIATANHIRVIASLPNATILDLDGELKILGQQYPELLGEESLVHQAHDIKILFELQGMAELGILLNGGDLLVLALGKDGGKTLERHRPEAGRAVHTLAFGLYPSRVLAIPCHRPDTILNFASWDAFCRWQRGNEVTKPDRETIELVSPIDHLIGNMDSFTALLRDGQVCTLAPKVTTSQAPPAPMSTSAEVSENTTHSQSSSGKADFEEPEISALLADMPSSAPLKPSSRGLQLAFVKVPTAAKAITTHRLSKVTGVIAAEGTAYLFGPQPTPSSDTPSLPSLSSTQTPLSIDLPRMHDTRISSLAIGRSHAVVLTSSGDVYSAGDGKAGQLGIGDSVFGIRAKDTPGLEFHPLADEPEEYADHWERVDGMSAAKNQVREVIAGAETTFLVVESY